MEQLYSIQCEDQQVDLDVISRVQCRSVPTNADKSGTGCSEPTNLDINAVFTETVRQYIARSTYTHSSVNSILHNLSITWAWSLPNMEVDAR